MKKKLIKPNLFYLDPVELENLIYQNKEFYRSKYGSMKELNSYPRLLTDIENFNFVKSEIGINFLKRRKDIMSETKKNIYAKIDKESVEELQKSFDSYRIKVRVSDASLELIDSRITEVVKESLKAVFSNTADNLLQAVANAKAIITEQVDRMKQSMLTCESNVMIASTKKMLTELGVTFNEKFVGRVKAQVESNIKRQEILESELSSW